MANPTVHPFDWGRQRPVRSAPPQTVLLRIARRDCKLKRKAMRNLATSIVFIRDVSSTLYSSLKYKYIDLKYEYKYFGLKYR